MKDNHLTRVLESFVLVVGNRVGRPSWDNEAAWHLVWGSYRVEGRLPGLQHGGVEGGDRQLMLTSRSRTQAFTIFMLSSLSCKQIWMHEESFFLKNPQAQLPHHIWHRRTVEDTLWSAINVNCHAKVQHKSHIGREMTLDSCQP